MLKRIFSLLFLNVLFLVTVACGGGGGGDNISPQPTGAITEANAQDVTSSVLSSAVEVVDLIEIANVIGLPGVPPPNQGIVSRTRVALPGLSLAGVRVQDIITETVACDSGQFTVTWDDADNDMDVSTGDTFDIVFEDCFFAIVDVTLNGSISITDITITGDAINEIAPWSVAATFVFDNLQGTDAIDTATIDGDLTLAMSSDDNVVLDVSVSTTALTVMQSGVTETLSDFVLTESADLNTLTITASASGTYNSTEFDGPVSFETRMPFVVLDGENPSQGQLFISDPNSSVLITVIDNMSVQLDIDIDGDGDIDRTRTVLWEDLDIGD